jgi:tetratricopeptide (TPR) repeat protein
MKREIIDLAKQLLVENKIKEAAEEFQKAKAEYLEELDYWDVFFMLKCAKNGGSIAGLEELADKFINQGNVNTMYAWLLFKNHVSGFDKNRLHQHETAIEKITQLVPQKDFNQPDVDSIPCPYTLGVLKLVKAYRKPNLNPDKVEYWLGKLDPIKLSQEENVFEDASGKERHLASPLEDYYSFLADVHLKRDHFDECIAICNDALNNIKRFHYDNKIWFNRKKALALIGKGEDEEGIKLLIDLSKDRKGEKWFIFHEIAAEYFKREDFEHALKYCTKAILAQGDEAFKVNLFLDTGRTLFKLDRLKDAKNLANYLAGIALVYDKSNNKHILKMLGQFDIDLNSIEDAKKHLNQYRRKVIDQFTQEEFKDKPKEEGEIIKIHQSGKSGNVRSSKRVYFFSMRDAKCHPKQIKEGNRVLFTHKLAQDRDGNPDKHAVIIKTLN